MKQAVICILENTKGKALFVKRSANKKRMASVWALPSGMVGEGESPEDTIRREFKEEYGIEVHELVLIDKIIEEEKGRGKIEKLIFKVKPKSSLAVIRFNLIEAEGAIFMTFKEFYARFSDQELGYILIYLRDKYLSLGFR